MRFGFFALLAAGTLFAQRPTPGGLGSVLYPGTGSAPNARPGYTAGAAGSGRIGIGVAPGGIRNVAPSHPVRHPQHPRTVVVPYPVYYGGYGVGYPIGYTPEGPAPSPQYSEPEHQQAPPPVVIINQYFRPDTVNPQVRDYSNAPLPQTMPQQQPTAAPVDDSPSYYLVAKKDHAIIAVITYWVDGETLHYVTLQGDQDRVALDLVDRDFSKQLNADRRIEFKLPAK
jgi:hypothetical protein